MSTSRVLCGRERIYTDEAMITESNIFKVLRESMLVHMQNVSDMAFLIDYEKGVQPLVREKSVRKDVDIRVSDNVANQIIVFKCGYIWGSPILYVLRGNKKIDDETDRLDEGVTLLNEMNELEYSPTKDQELARYVEICGIGYQMIDVRPMFEDSAFEIVTLNPLHTFCIYRNTAKQEKVAGVTFCKDKSGNTYFTVFTPTHRYEVKNILEFGQNGRIIKDEWLMGEHSGDSNPLESIPIVEYNRATDRTGAFERQISDMDALNVEVSDFANTVAQTTQEIWWANDFELPKDPTTGKPVKPQNGQWLMTQTIAQGTPKLQPLHSALDLTGVQANIESKRNLILQKAYVPLQVEANGGSTGSAMSMSAGWSAAESAACMEEQILRKSKMEIVQLQIKAINTTTGIPSDSPLKLLKASDIKPQFTRNKTYDLITKVNGMVTMINAGINGRVAMETADLFPDVAQAWADSKDTVERYQESFISKGIADNGEPIPSDNDLSAQVTNSPFVNGMDMQDVNVGDNQ